MCLMQRLGLTATILGLMLGMAGPARADYLYGDSEGSVQIYKFDSTTGKTLGSVPITGTTGGLRDIIGDGHGQLLLSAWGPTGAPGGDDELFRLNPATGATTLIGPITDGNNKYYWTEGLAWVHGNLYGSAAAILGTNPPTYLGYAPDTSNLLIKIDPTTGHATEVGVFGPSFLNVQNLAYSPTYGLIGSDIGTLDPDPNQPNGPYSSFHTTPALIRIDPATGQAVKIADLPHDGLVNDPSHTFVIPSGPFVSGLEFSPDGSTLYGSTIQTHFGGTSSGLVTIDPVTGALTPLATVDAPSLLGIAFISVPEPSGMVLIGLGLACAGVRARFRR